VNAPILDERALADALLRMSSNADEARSMGRKGRAFVETELSLEQMQTAHEELYWRALDLPAPAAVEPRNRLAANA